MAYNLKETKIKTAEVKPALNGFQKFIAKVFGIEVGAIGYNVTITTKIKEEENLIYPIRVLLKGELGPVSKEFKIFNATGEIDKQYSIENVTPLSMYDMSILCKVNQLIVLN